VSRSGFSLIEIMISVVIFSAVILGLAGLAFQVARHSVKATDQAFIMSVLLSKVDRASTVSYDSLSIISGCDSTLSGVVRIYGCTTVTVNSPRLTTVRVVVATSIAGAKPDTIILQRGRERRPVPLR
jgi:prepilin-type N-terminal cleavage/methylation domain-containing protein